MADTTAYTHTGRKHWLKPRWYVTGMGGGWSAGSPYSEGGITAIPDDEPDPVCRLCEKNLLDCGSYYRVDAGIECNDCHTPVEFHPLVRLWWRITGPLSSRYEELYWDYCERKGERHAR